MTDLTHEAGIRCPAEKIRAFRQESGRTLLALKAYADSRAS